MNLHGVPNEVLDHYAKEAGLSGMSFQGIIAEAIVHLIEKDGNSEIVKKSEMERLRSAKAELDEIREHPDHAPVAEEVVEEFDEETFVEEEAPASFKPKIWRMGEQQAAREANEEAE